jgi:hypothetical protein
VTSSGSASPPVIASCTSASTDSMVHANSRSPVRPIVSLPASPPAKR